VFASFTYRSVSLGQAVRSPFSIHAKVKDGKIAFFQFMEDTFATARSFRSNGARAIQTQLDGSTPSRCDERAPSARQGSRADHGARCTLAKTNTARDHVASHRSPARNPRLRAPGRPSWSPSLIVATTLAFGGGRASSAIPDNGAA
jgi:hypothetical protein